MPSERNEPARAMTAAKRSAIAVERRAPWIIWIVGVGLVSAGCLSLEQMAPPVGPEFMTVSRGHTVAPALLEQGRNVYLTDCTRCHSVEPIGRYSAQRWEDIVARMAAESKLDDSRAAALRAYVFTAHDVLARRAASKETRERLESAVPRRERGDARWEVTPSASQHDGN